MKAHIFKNLFLSYFIYKEHTHSGLPTPSPVFSEFDLQIFLMFLGWQPCHPSLVIYNGTHKVAIVAAIKYMEEMRSQIN